MAFRGNVDLVLRGFRSPGSDYTGDVLGALVYQISLSNGGGDNQAHEVIADIDATIAGSATVSIDLAALTNAFGAAVSAVEVVAFAVSSASTNTGNIEITPASSNGFTGFLKDASDVSIVPPGGLCLWCNPQDGSHAVSGSNKAIDVINTIGTAQTYSFAIVVKTS